MNFVNSTLFQFLGLGQCCLQFKYGYIFLFLYFYFLIFFLHIPYPACRHITSFFLSPYPFPELLYTVIRWCFFYHNVVFLFLYRIFPYFAIKSCLRQMLAVSEITSVQSWLSSFPDSFADLTGINISVRFVSSISVSI